ncbi:hypothetical protein VTI74DRAFT_7018 [Chaetomium olivicolor]
MPRTFRDAVLATRALGFRYVWIDSLCILQDSVADWAAEPARMAPYFSNAAAVLCAAHAASSREGLFRARDPRAHQPAYVALALPAWHRGGERRVRVHREMRWYGWGPSGRKGTGPLDGRAWTMQEQMLAKKTVRWEGEMVRWECGAGEADENLPDMNDVDMEKEGKMKRGEGWWTRLLLSHADGGMGKEVVVRKGGGLEKWRLYFDILPAIGGFASRFEELVEDRYVAGLWEGDIHRGLLWTVEGPIREGEQRFKAPTWSWASVNLTSIKFDKMPNPEYEMWNQEWFEVEETHTPLATANEYGEVDGGILKAKGYMRSLQLGLASFAGKVYEYRKNILQNRETEEKVGDIFLDCPRMSTDPQLEVSCMPVLHTGPSFGTLIDGKVWITWLDGWGPKNGHAGTADVSSDIDCMLSQEYHFSLYMFHGDSRFAFGNGAGGPKPTQPQFQSYDYGAVLDETGRIAPTYNNIRNAIAKQVSHIPALPSNPHLQSISDFAMTPLGGMVFGYILYEHVATASASGKLVPRQWRRATA